MDEEQSQLVSFIIGMNFLFIPYHMLVAGYDVFRLAVCVSICTSFQYDDLSIYKQISFRFCICICTNNVSWDCYWAKFDNSAQSYGKKF